jgi:hypothetical protein
MNFDSLMRLTAGGRVGRRLSVLQTATSAPSETSRSKLLSVTVFKITEAVADARIEPR